MFSAIVCSKLRIEAALTPTPATRGILSPEYVFQMREGDFVPDDRRFGVFWMRHDELAAAYNMEGAFNSVTIKLSPGAGEADVLARLDRLIEPYGGLVAYGCFSSSERKRWERWSSRP